MPRRASFAFGIFDLLEGLPVDHQYDRLPSVPRPGRPVLLRVHLLPGYRDPEVVALAGRDPVPPAELARRGRVHPARRCGPAFEAVLPPRSEGTVVHYLVRARDRRGGVWYADGRRPLQAATVFAHRVTSRRPPSWTEDAVLYQIVVDRFARAEGPVGPPGPDGWAGGDLAGVRAALPYLEELGVTAVWLTPICSCVSYHGYDAVDLRRVHPRFGGAEALRSLVEEAHRRGLRILLDLVPNHVSDRHPWFEDALAGGPHREWFHFRSDGSYDTFFGNPAMPKLNLDHPEAREAVIGAALHWLDDFEVDGFRIDHVHGPGESFLAALAEGVGRSHPEAWLFGEATASAQVIRRFGGLLDGATDFPTAYLLRDLLCGRASSEELREVIDEAEAILPQEEFAWVRFLDNHDMDRISWLLDGSGRVATAVGALASLPGVPCLLYGTEQGLSQERGSGEAGLDVVRVPMRFDRPRLLDRVRRLIRERPSGREALVWEEREDSLGWWRGSRAFLLAPDAGTLGEGPVRPQVGETEAGPG